MAEPKQTLVEIDKEDLHEAEQLLKADPGGNVVRRVALALRSARRSSHHMTGEMHELCELAKKVCHSVPMETVLPEQAHVAASFRALVKRLPERYAAPRDIRLETLNEIERRLREEFEEPFSLAECLEFIDEVRGRS